MKHTIGPWDTKNGHIYQEESGATLALIPYFDEENEWQRANAHLIATAPDLLEACVNALNDIDYYLREREENPNLDPTFQELEQAIAKAEGR